MISLEQITATGRKYLAHRTAAENATNKRERHAEFMVSGINRSTLNDYLVILRANLHDADCKQVLRIVTLLGIVETYLDGKEPEKSQTEEYIKVAYDGSLFFCQRFAMVRNGQPTDNDEAMSGYAKFDAPSVTKLVVALRESGKLQPVYVRHAGGFRKVG